MEFLGYTVDIVRKSRNKWNQIDLVFDSQEKFCESTSKLLSGFKDDCRFVIADIDDVRYFVNVLDYRFSSKENIIKIFPEQVRVVKK